MNPLAMIARWKAARARKRFFAPKPRDKVAEQIAANAARADRLLIAARAGSLTAHSRLVDMATEDSVNAARRAAASHALAKLAELKGMGG